MSQAGSLNNSGGGGGGGINTLIGDVGSATGSNVTVSGGSTGLTTTASGSTMDLTGTLDVANGGTGDTSFTAYSVITGGTTSTGALQNVSGVGTSGYVLTSNGAGALPTWQAATGGVTSVTGTANQILASPTTGNVVLSLIGPYTPATYTAHGVLIGEGTSSIVAVADTAASGIPLISQSGADPAFGTALVPGGGTGDTSFTAYSVICGGTTSTAALQNVSGVGSSGQILTSNGSSALPTWQAAPSVSVTWTDESTSFSAAANNGYFVTGTATATLPASPSQGNTIYFIVDTTNILTITANTGQTIRIGSTVSASAGTAVNNVRGDSLTLVYRSADTSWICLGAPQGTWTVT